MNELQNYCKYCDSQFLELSTKNFANHVRWCVHNTQNGDKGLAKFKASYRATILDKLGEFKTFQVACKTCKTEFLVIEREKKFPTKSNYFCCRSCANSRGPRTVDFKLSIKKKLTKSVMRLCKFCNSKFETKPSCKKQFCNVSCSMKKRYSSVDKTSLKYYRQLCSFKFNLNDFKDEFDFSLIETHGWYSAKNRKNNLNGVSRDHIVSVKFGYVNKISPQILSHPANCRLICHSDNISKGDKCFLTIDELLIRIKFWNEKYGELVY